LSYVDFNAVTVYGAYAPGTDGNPAYGNGVNIFGAANTTFTGQQIPPPVQIYFTGCNFVYLAAGIIYGSYTQGVSVVSGVFLGTVRGIYCPIGSIGTNSLLITACVFDCWTACIDLEAEVINTSITACYFIVENNAIGIDITAAANTTIVGNNFTAGLVPPGGSAIKIDATKNPVLPGCIVGNSINPNFNIGINLTGLMIVMGNQLAQGITTPITGGGSGDTGTIIQVNKSGTMTFERVTQGAANSGGAGFSQLVVPN
jgi:hypothetical protein